MADFEKLLLESTLRSLDSRGLAIPHPSIFAAGALLMERLGFESLTKLRWNVRCPHLLSEWILHRDGKIFSERMAKLLVTADEFKEIFTIPEGTRDILALDDDDCMKMFKDKGRRQNFHYCDVHDNKVDFAILCACLNPIVAASRGSSVQKCFANAFTLHWASVFEQSKDPSATSFRWRSVLCDKGVSIVTKCKDGRKKIFAGPFLYLLMKKQGLLTKVDRDIIRAEKPPNTLNRAATKQILMFPGARTRFGHLEETPLAKDNQWDSPISDSDNDNDMDDVQPNDGIPLQDCDTHCVPAQVEHGSLGREAGEVNSEGGDDDHNRQITSPTSDEMPSANVEKQPQQRLGDRADSSFHSELLTGVRNSEYEGGEDAAIVESPGFHNVDEDPRTYKAPDRVIDSGPPHCRSNSAARPCLQTTAVDSEDLPQTGQGPLRQSALGDCNGHCSAQTLEAEARGMLGVMNSMRVQHDLLAPPDLRHLNEQIRVLNGSVQCIGLDLQRKFSRLNAVLSRGCHGECLGSGVWDDYPLHNSPSVDRAERSHIRRLELKVEEQGRALAHLRDEVEKDHAFCSALLRAFSSFLRAVAEEPALQAMLSPLEKTHKRCAVMDEHGGSSPERGESDINDKLPTPSPKRPKPITPRSS